MIITPHWPIPLGAKPIDLGLERIQTLLDRLGNPEKKLAPVIHVAGTNGKGSTVAFMRAILEAAGYRVHVYTSPHLVHFNERIVVAGKEIDDAFLYDVLEECRLASENISITFFEGTTAAAFLAFSRIKADVVLLETGLGGRLDATNVLARPALTVITPISLDHTEFLGSTIAEIAGEKAGIVKSGVPCVVSAQAEDALRVIMSKAETLHSPLLMQGKDWQVEAQEDGFSYNGIHFPTPSLIGKHQLMNAGAAITAIKTLKEFSVKDKHIAKGLINTTHKARLQKLDTGNLAELMPEGWELWLDGGHNPAGGEILAAVADTWQDKPLYLISGMLQDKDSVGFFKPLAGKVKQVVCVPILDEPKSCNPKVLSEKVQQAGMEAVSENDIVQAINHIISNGKPARILICGSLYLAGHVLGLNKR